MKELKRLRAILKIDTSNYEQFENCISDLLRNKTVCSMDKFRQHSDISCLEHCLNVAYKSYLICRFLKLDFRSAARGALLHDLFLYDWHVTRPEEGLHAFSHPHIALKNASGIFVLNNIEKDVIVKHMWPLTIRLPLYMESIIVSFADKLCALLEISVTNKRSRLFRRSILLKYRLDSI